MAKLPDGSRNLSRTRAARAQRRDMGVSERLMWELLRDSRTGFKFRRQVPVLQYILDFYCAEAMLCVETDGELHAGRVEQDALRDLALAEIGVLTVRVPTLDLFEETSIEGARWLKKIVAACEERTGRKAWERSNP